MTQDESPKITRPDPTIVPRRESWSVALWPIVMALTIGIVVFLLVVGAR